MSITTFRQQVEQMLHVDGRPDTPKGVIIAAFTSQNGEKTSNNGN